MSILVVAEHDNASLNASTLSTLAAASEIGGDVTVLVAGHNAAGAIAAGCDVVLYCNAPLEDRQKVAKAAGEMTPSAQTRAERALSLRKTPDDIDISALDAQLEALLGGAGHG